MGVGDEVDHIVLEIVDNAREAFDLEMYPRHPNVP